VRGENMRVREKRVRERHIPYISEEEEGREVKE
jgi:hypothetical protein